MEFWIRCSKWNWFSDLGYCRFHGSFWRNNQQHNNDVFVGLLVSCAQYNVGAELYPDAEKVSNDFDSRGYG